MNGFVKAPRRHLYLYSTDGKLVHALTRGEWEVTALAGVDETKKTVYYVSTARSPLERHLYRVGVSKSLPFSLSAERRAGPRAKAGGPPADRRSASRRRGIL